MLARMHAYVHAWQFILGYLINTSPDFWKQNVLSYCNKLVDPLINSSTEKMTSREL